MGIDAHALNLLRYANRKRGGLGSTITIGRMAVHLGPRAHKRWTNAAPTSAPTYGDGILREHFGATSVDSIDNSDYEGATIVADLNQPMPPDNSTGYDSVLDFGCMEHIFDVRQAMSNMTSLCRVGGTILHILPANGYCGHGFYQFSPELFFSYYTPQNGFAGTEVFLADLLDTNHWYKVTPPSNGRRVNIRSGREICVIVYTERVAQCPAGTIQQSDYVHEWSTPATAIRRDWKPARAAIREWLFGIPLLTRFAHDLDSALSPKAPKRLGRHNRDLTKIRVDAF